MMMELVVEIIMLLMEYSAKLGFEPRLVPAQRMEIYGNFLFMQKMRMER